MRRGRGRCVICTTNSDEFPTFEPESYLSSRSRDCLLRALARSLAHPAVPSITRSVKRARARAHLRSMIRCKDLSLTGRSNLPQNERYRNKICPRLPTYLPTYRPSFSSVLHRQRDRWSEREIEREREKDTLRRRGLLATRVGGAAFCFFLTVSLLRFLSFVWRNAIRKVMRRRNSIPNLLSRTCLPICDRLDHRDARSNE